MALLLSSAMSYGEVSLSLQLWQLEIANVATSSLFGNIHHFPLSCSCYKDSYCALITIKWQ